MRAGASALLGLSVLLWAYAVSHAQSKDEPYRSVAEIVRDRETIVRALVQPIARCVHRRDTDHPVFHGCMDFINSLL